MGVGSGDGQFPASPYALHDGGMARTRLSATVDAALLEKFTERSSLGTSVKKSHWWTQHSPRCSQLAGYRSAEVDAGYGDYHEHPLDEPDEWGGLASFRRTVAASLAPSPSMGKCGLAGPWPYPGGGGFQPCPTKAAAVRPALQLCRARARRRFHRTIVSYIRRP